MVGGTVGSAPQRKGSLKQGRALAVPSAAGGRWHAQQPALCRRRRANGAGRSPRPSRWSALRTPLLPGRLERLVVHLYCGWCCKPHPTSTPGFQQVALKVIGSLASSAGSWSASNQGNAARGVCGCAIFPPVPSTDVSESPMAFTRGSGGGSSSPGSGGNTSPWTPPKVRGEQRPGHEAWAGPVTGVTVPDTSL